MSLPIPLIDISGETDRHVFVARGTETVYHCAPTTVLMPDKRTMFAVWTHEHAGTCGPIKRSTDGGLTWSELLPVPENWRSVRNAPTIYRLVDPSGMARLFVFAGCWGSPEDPAPENVMHQSYSEDDGATWSPMASNRLECVMPFCSIEPIDGGSRLLGMTNIRRAVDRFEPPDTGRPQREPNRSEHFHRRWVHLEPMGHRSGHPPSHPRQPGDRSVARRLAATVSAGGQGRAMGDDGPLAVHDVER